MTIESTKMSSDYVQSPADPDHPDYADHPTSGKVCPVLFAEECYSRLEDDSAQGRSNVSRTATRLLSSSRSRKSWKGRTFRGALKWCFNIMCLAAWMYLLVPCAEAAASRTCQDLTEECALHSLSCRQSHSNTFMPIQFQCMDLLQGMSDTCSTECDQALQPLVDLPVKGWFTCDCTGYVFASFGESLCRGIQENLRVCPSYPPPEPEPISTTPSYVHVGSSPEQAPGGLTPTSPPKAMCADARATCEDSAGCQAALRNVLNTCEAPSCSTACINAIDKLEAAQESAAMWRCDCTGEVGEEEQENVVEETPWCSRFQDDFLQVCLDKEEEIRYGMLSSTPPLSYPDNESNDAGGNGVASPRLYCPPMFLAVCVASIVVILNLFHLQL